MKIIKKLYKSLYKLFHYKKGVKIVFLDELNELVSNEKVPYIKYVPLKEAVLFSEFTQFKNFFPIAIIDYELNDSIIQIPIVYVFFDASIIDTQLIDNYSFKLENNILHPDFNEHNLEITSDYIQHLNESINTYKSVKDSDIFIDFCDTPEWWQWDETPINKNGKMNFICQIDIYDIVNDDARLYVFFDFISSELRIITQRT